ncbi:MAG TPA: hypothetical protein DHV28_00710 [Ignavibacteriales bacterium]|nr:hypothetical protein [Ignavibacteriales bacterium]
MNNYVFSKYNIFKTIKDTVVGLNLINKALFALDVEQYNILKTYEHRLNKLNDKYPILFSTMFKLGIIVDKQIDNNQQKQILLKNRLIVFSEKTFRLTINPTLNCNFSCWYCYETHTQKNMSKERVSAIIKYIEHLVKNLHIHHLDLGWFGGEPLLSYKTVMKELAVAAKNICDQNGVSFQSDITTNGYLIKPDMIPFFKEINMQSFQITLDGEKDIHNKIRIHRNKDFSYDKIVKNICLLATELRPKNLALRINFTQESFDGIDKIIESFPWNIRSNITIMLQQVWQDKNNKMFSVKEIDEARLKFENAGFNIDRNTILNLKGYTCYADLYYQAVINYDGRVFKCTARNFEKEKEDGILTNEGNIIWTNSLAMKTSNATFENRKCLDCKYLPVCSGPCSQKISNVKDPNDFEKYCYVLGIEQILDYIMTEFEKSDKTLAYLLDYR